jgi:hypothetical protein
MRKLISISMAVLFFVSVITGFAESHVHPGSSGHHTVFSVLFMVVVFAHMALNSRAFRSYLFSSVKKTVEK